MNRLIVVMVVPVTAIILLAIFLSDEVTPEAALFRHDQCSVVQVTDARYRPMSGIEDIALLPGGRLLLSNYNRNFTSAPARGLNTVSITELLAGESGVFTRPVPGTHLVLGSLHPHGIAVDRSGSRLAVVNRQPSDDTAVVVWGMLTGDGFRERGRWEAPEACRANDLAWRGAELVVSVDRNSCDWTMSELMPGAASGSVLTLGFDRTQTMAEGLAWANGVSLDGGTVLVAETRANRITNLSDGTFTEFSGGPDNINPGPNGTQIVALHPDLFDYWMFTMQYSSTAPSRIVAWSPATGQQETLFDDPFGEVYSGATSAVYYNNTLIAGSAYGQGLLVCRR
ncbi:MAG: hypothetical protein AAFP17_04325 [Pseudomonadota bacterium]